MLLRKYEYFMDKNMFWFTWNNWNAKIESKMTYQESESDFSFAINSVSDFDSAFESDSDSKSESDFSSVLLNLDICIFFTLYLHPINKPADGFFFIYSHDRINSYTSNASIMHIFIWHITIQKVCFYHTIKFSYFSFQVFLIVIRFPTKFNA